MSQHARLSPVTRRRGRAGIVDRLVVGACILAVGVIGAVILTGWFAPGHAATVSPTKTWTQPYGGCDEAWQAPHSQGARVCRAHGWTVRPHFVIDPRNRLRSVAGMKPCPEEDSIGCYWNASRRGNGVGSSFVASFRGERFYVASW